MDGKGCWIDNDFIERVWRLMHLSLRIRYSTKS